MAHNLLAELVGLGCGVAHGLYIVGLMYVSLALGRVWRNVLLAFWPVHVAGPFFLFMFVVVPHIAPRHGTPLYWFSAFWLPPYLASLLWCHRKHPEWPRIEWGKGEG